MARTWCVRQARVIEAGSDTFGAKRIPVCDGLIAECTVRRGRPGARGRSPRAASSPGNVSADIGDGRIFTVIGVPTARLLTTPFRGGIERAPLGCGLGWLWPVVSPTRGNARHAFAGAPIGVKMEPATWVTGGKG